MGMQPKGGRARLRARPPFRYAFYSQNPQKCLRGGFFEGFRGPREGFLKVFQNFWGRRRFFLWFFEGFLLALESLCLAVSASSYFSKIFGFLFFFLFFFRFLFFYSFFYF